MHLPQQKYTTTNNNNNNNLITAIGWNTVWEWYVGKLLVDWHLLLS